jgi:hypothetical protein
MTCRVSPGTEQAAGFRSRIIDSKKRRSEDSESEMFVHAFFRSRTPVWLYKLLGLGLNPMMLYPQST